MLCRNFCCRKGLVLQARYWQQQELQYSLWDPQQEQSVGTEVLRYPMKTKNGSTDKMVELVVPAGIQRHDGFGRPEIQVMGLADTGARIDVLAGE